MNIVIKVTDTFTDLSKFSRLRCEKIGGYGCVIIDDMTGKSGILGVFEKTKLPYDFCTELLSSLRTGSKVFDASEYLYAQLPEDLVAEMEKNHETPVNPGRSDDCDVPASRP